MSLPSGLRRGPTWWFGLLGGLALLVAVVPASQVRATTPNLSGFWVVAGSPGGYTLRESKDSSVLDAGWAGVPPHQALQGHFQGTLDTAGDAYVGTFNVTEGAVAVSGNATFALESHFFANFPSIDVTLTPTSVSPGGFGGTSTFTLDIFAATPQILVPDGVTDEVTCPSTKPCDGVVNMGVSSGGALSVRRPATARASAAAKNAILGKTSFKIAPDHSRRITVSLNKQGRALLHKRGSLKVQLVIHMNASSGLPTVTKAGVVTIQK